MRFLVFLLIPVMTGVIIAGVKKEVFKPEKNIDERKFIVYQPTIMIWIGVITALFFGIGVVAMAIFPIFPDTTNWWIAWVVYFLFFAFTLFGIFLSLYCIFWEIRVDGNEIYFQSFLRRTKTFTFSDIKTVDLKTWDNVQHQQMILYSETKKLLCMESSCKGYGMFVTRLTQENPNNQ